MLCENCEARGISADENRHAVVLRVLRALKHNERREESWCLDCIVAASMEGEKEKHEASKKSDGGTA